MTRKCHKLLSLWEILVNVVVNINVDWLQFRKIFWISYGDEIKQYGQAILDNSTHKFFFGTDGQDLEEIVRIYNLNNEEKTILSQKDRGRGLMFVGPGHSLINVKGEEWEKPYLIGGGK